MQPRQPSLTALGVARHRAVHQVLEHGFIFSDPWALPILGPEGATAIREAQADPSRRVLRLFIAVRSRVAEEALRASIARGVRQVVLLGAGLDTFAYRAVPGEGLRIFEVDHPATQAWKRQRLSEAGIPIPRTLTFAAVDFEQETWAEGLLAAGFNPVEPAIFSWLGVVPYLTEEVVLSTLGFIAGLPGGAQVIFDYGNPPMPGPRKDAYSALQAVLASRVASFGEPFKSHFETEALHAQLSALGFSSLEDLGPGLIRARYFAHTGSSLPERGGHILLASTGPSARSLQAVQQRIPTDGR